MQFSGFRAALHTSSSLIDAHRLRRVLPRAIAAALLVPGMASSAAQAQSVWAGPGTNLNFALNWIGEVAPAGTPVRFENNGAPTIVSNMLHTSFGDVEFTSNAPSYRIELRSELSLTGSGGITNNSMNWHTFVANDRTIFVHGGSGTVLFMT